MPMPSLSEEPEQEPVKAPETRRKKRLHLRADRGRIAGGGRADIQAQENAVLKDRKKAMKFLRK